MGVEIEVLSGEGGLTYVLIENQGYFIVVCSIF